MVTTITSNIKDIITLIMTEFSDSARLLSALPKATHNPITKHPVKVEKLTLEG